MVLLGRFELPNSTPPEWGSTDYKPVFSAIFDILLSDHKNPRMCNYNFMP